MGKVFEYHTTITIGDTNLLQNMYFANIFKMQGICREMFVKDCVEGGLESLMDGLVLITKNASTEFIKDFYLYDHVILEMQISSLGKTYADLRFTARNEKTNEVHSIGTQRIVFASQSHKIVKIPDNFLKSLIEYSVNNEDIDENTLKRYGATLNLSQHQL